MLSCSSRRLRGCVNEKKAAPALLPGHCWKVGLNPRCLWAGSQAFGTASGTGCWILRAMPRNQTCATRAAESSSGERLNPLLCTGLSTSSVLGEPAQPPPCRQALPGSCSPCGLKSGRDEPAAGWSWGNPASPPRPAARGWDGAGARSPRRWCSPSRQWLSASCTAQNDHQMAA